MTLTEAERDHLIELTSRGKVAARQLIHAHILLHADEASPKGGLKDADLANAIHTSRLTVERVRQRFVMEGRADWTLQ